MEEQKQEQPIRVRVYESDERVMLAAPLPGLEPGDITINIENDVVTIRGDYRGPLKKDRAVFADDPTRLVLDEWAAGPYHREVPLPHPVNGELANATYGNGVLVLVMPKQEASEKGSPTQFRLAVVDAPRGEHVGHVGHDLRPVNTREHLRRVHNAAIAP